MKFCKDCKHFRPTVETLKWAVGPSCHARDTREEFDPVTGEQITYAGQPSELRGKDGECGPDAKWFEPATLEGRLAMLEEK